jgi:cyclase
MNDRRHFIKDLGYLTFSGIFLNQMLTSCKSNAMIKLNNVTSGPYVFKEIRNGVGYFKERGGTIGWSLHKDGVSVIDTQFPDQAKNLIGEIAKYKTAPFDLLINTHHHGDHTAGNILFKDKVKSHICHVNAKENLIKTVTAQNKLDINLIPTETFTDKKTINLGREKITLRYLGAGHTNGDAIVHYEDANVVHVGDLVFNRRFPFIDKPGGANIQSWVQSLEQIGKIFDSSSIYIFGHANEGYDVVGTYDDILAFKNYLEKLLDFGKKSIASGHTLDEIKANTKVIPGAEQWTGDGIARSLEAVYQEITSSK